MAGEAPGQDGTRHSEQRQPRERSCSSRGPNGSQRRKDFHVSGQGGMLTDRPGQGLAHGGEEGRKGDLPLEPGVTAGTFGKGSKA